MCLEHPSPSVSIILAMPAMVRFTDTSHVSQLIDVFYLFLYERNWGNKTRKTGSIVDFCDNLLSKWNYEVGRGKHKIQKFWIKPHSDSDFVMVKSNCSFSKILLWPCSINARIACFCCHFIRIQKIPWIFTGMPRLISHC